MTGAHDLCDLCENGAVSAQEVAQTLKTRFLSDQCYASIGHSALVVVNPSSKQLQVNADSELFSYLAESWDLPEEGAISVRQPLPPHLWQLASRAFFYARRTGEDQAILLRGVTGSGKSESRRLAIRALCEIAAPPPGKKGSRLLQAIPSAEYVLDCFGHASSALGPNTSFYGRYSEVQYGEKHRIAGYKTLEYHLDVTRVNGPPRGERNFHILHQLVAGASGDEAAQLRLDVGGSSGFRYLGGTSASVDDAPKLGKLKQALKAVGFPHKATNSIWQVLAAILHLGQLAFHEDRTRNADAAIVSNADQLQIVASLLGVEAATLESALNVSTRVVAGDRVTAFLDAEGCIANAGELARNLYRLLFAWISEYITSKLSKDDFSSFVAVVDMPGQRARSSNDLEDLIVNLENERLHAYLLEQTFEREKSDYEAEGVSSSLRGFDTAWPSNLDCLRMLTSMPGGIVHIIDDQSCRKGKSDATMLDALGKRWSNHASFGWRAGDDAGRIGSFTINHWDGQIKYSSEDMLAANRAAISTDFVTLLAGSAAVEGSVSSGTPGSSNAFLQQLFAREAEEARQAASKGLGRAGTLRAKPTIRRKVDVAGEKDVAEEQEREATTKLRGDARCFLGLTNANLDVLFEALRASRTWQVLCLKPNDMFLPNQVDAKMLRQQIGSLSIVELARRLQGGWAIALPFEDVWERFAKSTEHSLELLRLRSAMSPEKLTEIRRLLQLSEADLVVGKSKVFLSDRAYCKLDRIARLADEQEVKTARLRQQQEVEAQAGLSAPDCFSPFASPADIPVTFEHFTSSTTLATLAAAGHAVDTAYSDADSKSGFYDNESRYDDGATAVGSDSFLPRLDETGVVTDTSGDYKAVGKDTVEVVKTTRARKWWVALTWLFTGWMPGPLLKWFGGLKRPDVRMAWREKLLINILIWLLCGAAIFVIAFLGNSERFTSPLVQRIIPHTVICPHQYVYSASELDSGSFINDPQNELIAIRGEIFDLSGFAPMHSPSIVSLRSIQKYGGLDASNLFPVQVSALCQGQSGTISPWITLNTKNTSDPNAIYHDFRASTDVHDFRPDWYTETMIYLRSTYRKGFVGLTSDSVRKLSGQADTRNTVIYRDGVYDMTGYIQNGGGQPQSPKDTQTPPVSAADRAFMHQAITDIFASNGGNDVTSLIDNLNIGGDMLEAQRVCLRNLFFVGKVDTRNSPQCQFSRWILLAMSILIVSIIGFKFLAALNFGRSRQPEEHEKFVLLQVPCFTEGEDSLKKCLQSLAATKHDDKKKLILVVCDGNIVGSGNDRSTPRIVLDILGSDPSIDPEPMSFQSIGEGARQHNMGKVYSGLYEHAGHIVPYMVLVKVGKPSERSKPGNRGKRDSQLLIMRFLNRIVYSLPMSPCELELYHQLKNVIGIQPSFFEYLLSVDADTVVDSNALSRLIGSAMRDRKIIGICGETTLSNARHSWVTSIQVFEYFISHHQTKAFESLFGSVTCLPGCFTLFRIRSLEGKPLFCSNEILDAFGVNRVDTLHLKNLLHLGEDRYLTTLLMMHHPTYKTVFCRDAKAQTIAPEEWKVLLSQRRRWINSTIHNLFELLFVDRLCGFCCFSMRFVVLVDLMSTIVAPVTLFYVVYLIVTIARTPDALPIWSFVIIAIIYGLQAFLFLTLKAFDMIGWMLIYLLALPVFSLFLPLYSFWRQDDFSWGSTRVVTGERGKRLVVHDEGVFDPREIPLMRWQDYEEQLWETGSNGSAGEWVAPNRRAAAPRDVSLYGRASTMNLMHAFPPAAMHSPTASVHSSPGLHVREPRLSVASYFSKPPSIYTTHQPRPSMQSQLSRSSLQPRPSDEVRPSGETIRAPSHGLQAPSMIQLDVETLMEQTPYSDEPAGRLPSDEQVAADVRRSFDPFVQHRARAQIRAIVSISDLSKISKKMVRQQLEERYRVPIPAHKVAGINSLIEDAAMRAY